MTDVSNLDDLANAIANSSAKIKNYAKAQAAATQAQEPDIQSRAKQSDLAALAARVAALENPPPPPPPPPPPSGVQPPQAPITTVTDAAIGLNIYNQPDGSVWDDYDIVRTSDSGVIMTGTGSGWVIRRFRMRGIGQNTPHPGYGVHGIYCKIPNSLLEDLDIELSFASTDNASGVTLRKRGITVNRARLIAQFEICTYYEEDTSAGTVTFKNVTGQAGAGFWADTNGQPVVRQRFVFEDCHFTCGGRFASCATGKYAGAGITLTRCTLNGNPVTASSVAGISPVLIG